MSKLIDITERVGDICTQPDGAEVYATALGDYDEVRGELKVVLDSFVRSKTIDHPNIPRPEWLPDREIVKGLVSLDEATLFTREVLQGWVERLRQAIPGQIRHWTPAGNPGHGDAPVSL